MRALRVPSLLALLSAATALGVGAPRARGEEAGLDALLARADAVGWVERARAAHDLARLSGEDTVFAVRAALLRDERPRVRAVIAHACRIQPDLANASLLGIALKKDADASVRREAAQALIHFKDRRAVAALIEALGKETDTRARLHIAQTLRAITPAPCLLDAEAWAAWWKTHEHDPRFAPADEAARRGDFDGVPLETRTVAPIPGDGKKSERPPPHVLVLPPFGWNTALFGPYLLPLRRRAAITWVRLPTVQELTGRSGYGDDIPEYPVARLVQALDSFRETQKIDRFLVLGVGASGWIAMRYAVTHKDHCAGLVLLDTALDKAAYADALRRGAARGDAGEKFAAKTLLHQNSAPFNERTLERLHRGSIERGFLDRGDLEIADLFRHAREPQGFATVPEIAWSRHREIDLPALFLYSAAGAFSCHRDAERIQRHFPRSLIAPIKESRALPFIEENEKTHEIIEAFLDRFELG